MHFLCRFHEETLDERYPVSPMVAEAIRQRLSCNPTAFGSSIYVRADSILRMPSFGADFH